MIQDILLGIVRHTATGVGGWMMANGYLGCEHVSQCSTSVDGWLGSVMFLAGLGWSAYEKYRRVK